MKIKHNQFQSTLPTGWQDRTMITLVAPIKGKFAVNVVVTKHDVPTAQNIDAFAEAQTKQMRESLAQFEVIDARPATIKNLSAFQQLHRFQAEAGMLQQVQTFLLVKNAVYVITGTSLIDEFDDHVAAFRKIVEDLEITTE